MDYWDEDYGFGGIVLLVLAVDEFTHNPPLALLALLAGGYAFYKSFVTIDPDGV